jgi:Flp pilus assembly protein TadD
VHGIAAVFYETALLLEPENALYYNNLGYSLLLAGEVDQAIPHLEKAVQLDPRFRKARNNLGYAYGLKGEFSRALLQFRLATDEAGAYNNVGYLYLLKGNREQALAYFQKAIGQKPSWYVKAGQNLKAALGE